MTPIPGTEEKRHWAARFIAERARRVLALCEQAQRTSDPAVAKDLVEEARGLANGATVIAQSYTQS